MEKIVEELLRKGLNLDLTDPNLRETPQRISKMYCDFFANIGKEFEGLKSFPNDKNYNQIILLDNIQFTSMCSHHFLPFTGLAWFLYLPNKKLLGASKPARTVEHYGKRPQLQENLGQEIMDCIVQDIDPLGAMLVMRAIHGCMSCRGVKQSNGAGMTTSIVYGEFSNPAVRAEGFSLIDLSIKMKGLL